MRYIELVEAARDYPLYHGTSIDVLSHIILDDELHSRNGWDDHGEGVSLSADLSVAEGFAENGEIHARDISEINNRIGAVVEFSSDDLRKNFGLRRIRWEGDGSEKEMRTIKDIKPFSRHVRKIYLRKGDVQQYVDSVTDEPYARILKSLLNDDRVTWI